VLLRPGANGPVQIGLTGVAGVDTLTGAEEPGEIHRPPLATAAGPLGTPEQQRRWPPPPADSDDEPAPF
jgi:hypothetical protein